MARRSPSVPQTTPAMVPKCSSRLIRITESFSVARGENVRSASHPAAKQIFKVDARLLNTEEVVPIRMYHPSLTWLQ